MVDAWVIVACTILYIAALFIVAFWGDAAGSKIKANRARPTIYALTLAVYCTSWTFFGSIGNAASSGFDFIAVYLGPIIAFTAGRPLLRRIIRLVKMQNITSIADFIAARYGKSPTVAAVVAVTAIVGVLPYIALQLKAITQSITTLAGHSESAGALIPILPIKDTTLLIAVVLAVFAILFGARNSDATEHQRGLMLAIAFESVVKVTAFLLVGGFIVFGMFGGLNPLLHHAASYPEVMNLYDNGLHGGTLVLVTLLSFFCIFLLPRQFHVTFVENVSEEELRRASWLFPVYLVVINIFVVPVAIAGLLTFGKGNVPKDMFLLSLPLSSGSTFFTMAAFAGGLSAAMAMVIMETVALAIMVSNDLLMPLLLRRRATDNSGTPATNMSRTLLNIRRAAIVAIVLLAYGFYDPVENASLASIGLLSFAAVAQLAPAFLGGLIWRRATGRGAIAGICAGFAIWVYTLVLPYLKDLLPVSLFHDGPFGIGLLKPEALFYLKFDPLTHGVFWSLSVNLLCFVTVSLLRAPEPIERLQANVFIPEAMPVYDAPAFRPWRASITMQDLIATVSRYLGEERTVRSFTEYAQTRGIPLDGPADADIHAVRFTENLLASAIGAASSRLVMSLTLRRRNVGVGSALKLLDDASEAIQYNRDLLQTALDHVRQGLAVFDKDMRLICWNRQFREILDLPPHLGRFRIPLDQIVRHIAQRTQTSPTAVEEIVTDRITKYVVTKETFHERAIEGRVVEVRTNAMPHGRIVVTYTDITERVADAEALSRAKENLEVAVAQRTAELTAVNRELESARAKADEANQSKTRFLAAASHDILQPLNAARLYAASLLERGGAPEISRLARNIDGSLDAVEEILNALLDISRLDSGAMRAEYSIFPLNELFEQLRIDFEPIAKSRGLSFTIIPTAAFVRSDRRLLRRILQNLVSNALKYTEKGGAVLGCRKRGRNIVVEVHDTGPGIPDSKRTVIFKEFQRLDHKRDTAPGLGLGLSIVERMCRVLDHPLALTSKVGRGSTFSVTLPLARWNETEKPRPFATRPMVPFSNLRGTIALCLDNDPAILDGMVTLLTGWQCVPITAVNSADAIEKLRQSNLSPDIIISDYHLDTEDGVGAIRRITQAEGSDIPAIVITADRSASLRALVPEAGYALLYKPVKPAALRALMAQMASKRHVAA
jgi:Na+/proline symporter/signal transduction histidine kinase/CheY-like chemotaxis protein